MIVLRCMLGDSEGKAPGLILRKVRSAKDAKPGSTNTNLNGRGARSPEVGEHVSDISHRKLRLSFLPMAQLDWRRGSSLIGLVPLKESRENSGFRIFPLKP